MSAEDFIRELNGLDLLIRLSGSAFNTYSYYLILKIQQCKDVVEGIDRVPEVVRTLFMNAVCVYIESEDCYVGVAGKANDIIEKLLRG